MSGDNFSNKINPYDPDELKKYFDPVVFQNLNDLTISEIRWIRLTIAFWDLSGFSELCKQLIDNQSNIISFLKEYFDEGAKIISDRKGILDKFIGDGIMAYFGYPGDDANNSPTEAIMAPLEFRENFQKIKERYAKFWLSHHGKLIEVDLKCGIHTGYVFFGLLETERRKQITVIGHTVNLSSRLEKIATKNEITVSEELRNIAQHQFEFEPKEIEDQIKSFEDIKGVFKVVGRK